MHILLDLSRVNLGGAIQNAVALLDMLAKNDLHDRWTVVLSRRLGREIRSDHLPPHIQVTRLRYRNDPLSQLFESQELRRIENAVRPDIVFTLFGPGLWRSRCPHVEGYAIPHPLYPEVKARTSLGIRDRLSQYWRDFKFDPKKFFIVESEAVKARMSAHLHVAPEHIFVVRNSFSSVFAKQASGLARMCTYRRGTYRILVPSAYYAHKNLEIIPLVAAELQKRIGDDFRFEFTIDREANGWREIARRAQEHGVEKHVYSHGEVSHAKIALLYATAHLAFLPTLLECSTAVIPESLLASVPLVISDREFASEFGGAAVHYVDPLSPISCATAIYTLLTDASLRERHLAAAPLQLRTNYPSPLEKWQDQLTILHDLASRSTSSRLSGEVR